MITQTPKEFDFPIPHLPPQFHYAGPFHDNEGRKPIPFPWEKLTGKPLIYASMGTIVNGLNNVYSTILEAVGEFPEMQVVLSGMQVVLSVGKNFDPGDLCPIPSNTIVVRIAPQIELLKRAALCIIHAGLNTALEVLAQGVPMVAIPIGYDQPGVTARRLSELIVKVTANPNYRDKARWFQKVLGETCGLSPRSLAGSAATKSMHSFEPSIPQTQSKKRSHTTMKLLHIDSTILRFCSGRILSADLVEAERRHHPVSK